MSHAPFLGSGGCRTGRHPLPRACGVLSSTSLLKLTQLEAPLHGNKSQHSSQSQLWISCRKGLVFQSSKFFPLCFQMDRQGLKLACLFLAPLWSSKKYSMVAVSFHVTITLLSVLESPVGVCLESWEMTGNKQLTSQLWIEGSSLLLHLSSHKLMPRFRVFHWQHPNQ